MSFPPVCDILATDKSSTSKDGGDIKPRCKRVKAKLNARALCIIFHEVCGRHPLALFGPKPYARFSTRRPLDLCDGTNLAGFNVSLVDLCHVWMPKASNDLKEDAIIICRHYSVPETICGHMEFVRRLGLRLTRHYENVKEERKE